MDRTAGFNLSLIVLLAAGLIGCGPAAPATQDLKVPEVTERITSSDGVLVARLSNGLTVIIKPTRTAPVVCVRAYVRAGGLYERKWLGCGISHLTEHLVATGAVHDHVPGAAIQRPRQTGSDVTQIGGQSNAYTSLGHTCYYISAAASKTMDCIDLLAERLGRPEITAADFRREHGVVQRELEMGLDSPTRELQKAHLSNIFGTHPAAVPVIGYKAPLSRLRFADALAYHRQMYVPQNMVFCVVGDVEAMAVLKQIRRAFAGFEADRVPDLSLPEVQTITGVREVVRPHPALKETLEQISFLTIPLLDEDLYALDVLSYVLTKGRSSRLVRKIERRDRLVTSISSSSWTPAWGRGIFTVFFRASPDKADAARAAILAELKDVISEGVKDDELTRAKRQKVADFVYARQSVASQAEMLATDYLATGDVQFSRNYTRRIQSVTAEEVLKVARKYFTFDGMAITRLVPRRRFAPTATTRKAKESQETATLTLPNGLRVILHPVEEAGLVSMALVTKGGLLSEDEKTNGMGTLMTALSTRGTHERSAEQISAFFDSAGGTLTGKCGNNSFYWQATVLADSFEESLKIFADVILHPAFSTEELDILKPVLLARIKRQDEQWQSQLQKFFRSKFFTASPYRLTVAGRKSVIESATPEQLIEYHRGHVKAGDSVLTIYGSFDAAAGRKTVERLFAKLPAGKGKLKIPPARRVGPAGERHVLKTQNNVAGIIVAAPGMKLENLEDRLAMTVLDTIISGYRLPAGWLHSELRGRQLVYVVHAYNWAGLAPGAFVTYAASPPEKADEVARIIVRKLDKAAAYQPTRREIDQAVNTILTAELLENQSISALAMLAALDELYGFGYDFRSRLESLYHRIRPADVLRVGKKYLGGGYVVIITTPKPQASAAPTDTKQTRR